MSCACPNDAGDAVDDLDVVAPLAQAVGPVRRRPRPRRRRRWRRRRPRCRSPTAAGWRSAHRGAPIAVPADWRWRSNRASSCRRICGCVSPPMVPMTARRPPSGRVTTAGARVWGGRRPGPYSAGWPGSSEKPMPRLCSPMPVAGSKSSEPNPDALDWISDTPMRSRSTAHRYIVSPAPRALAGAPARAGSTSARRRADLVAVEQPADVGALVQHRRAVVRGGARGLDEQVRPRAVRRATSGKASPSAIATPSKVR